MSQEPLSPDPILVVDDDASVTASVALLLKQRGYACLKAAGPAAALDLLSSRPVSLVLQDMNFSRATGGEEGLALLAEIRRRSDVPVILMTAWGSIDLAVRGMRAGASDFLTKPWSNEGLAAAVETALELRRARRAAGETAADRRVLDEAFDFSGVVGEDPELLRILQLVGRVAATDASVLITGESGTGKEGLAEALHRNSRRRHAPFVKVNLGGVASSLFESEMFGHVRGAFTDARADRQGRFAVADGGTIFLDELGELDPASQVKLLRVLQDHSFEVLGSSATTRVDVRVVSATHRDLTELVESGAFREDLFYRLNLITVELPPLRRRPGDIPRLARWFLGRNARLYGREGLELAESACVWLQEQSWPGNIRQLKQSVERAVLLGARDRLTADDFRALEGATPKSAVADLPAPGTMTLDAMEEAMIRSCLVFYRANITKVARALGLSRAALYRRFEKYSIDPSTFVAEEP